jgi:hypothetical protein
LGARGKKEVEVLEKGVVVGGVVGRDGENLVESVNKVLVVGLM